MTEQEDHEAKADDAERSLDEMEERSGRLGDDIEGAGEDWERKQRDPGVPGAVGDADDEGDEPAGDGEELDFGSDVDYQEVAAPAGQAGGDSASGGDDDSGGSTSGEDDENASSDSASDDDEPAAERN